MKKWERIWHGSPQQIRQATHSRRVFTSEKRKRVPADFASSHRAISAATMLKYYRIIIRGISLYSQF